MTERLQRVLAQIEHLPPAQQDAIAEQLEVWTEPDVVEPPSTPHTKRSYAGIWANRPDMADMIEELDRMRRESLPTPPLEDADF